MTLMPEPLGDVSRFFIALESTGRLKFDDFADVFGFRIEESTGQSNRFLFISFNIQLKVMVVINRKNGC